MSTFERYLTVWVALCIVAGVALGHVLPGVFQAIGSAEVAQVNLPVAVLIWLRDRNYPVFVPVIASALTLALGVVAARLAGNKELENLAAGKYLQLTEKSSR